MTLAYASAVKVKIKINVINVIKDLHLLMGRVRYVHWDFVKLVVP